jgi:hypothetical protein
MSYQQQQQKVNAENRERERRKLEDDLEQQNEVARKVSICDDHEQNLENALFFENPNRQPSYSSISIEYDQLKYVREKKTPLFSIQNKIISFRNMNLNLKTPCEPLLYYSKTQVLFVRIKLQLLMNIKVMIQRFHFSMMHNEIPRA